MNDNIRSEFQELIDRFGDDALLGSIPKHTRKLDASIRRVGPFHEFWLASFHHAVQGNWHPKAGAIYNDNGSRVSAPDGWQDNLDPLVHLGLKVEGVAYSLRMMCAELAFYKR